MAQCDSHTLPFTLACPVYLAAYWQWGKNRETIWGSADAICVAIPKFDDEDDGNYARSMVPAKAVYLAWTHPVSLTHPISPLLLASIHLHPRRCPSSS